ncbi:hypothetical protein YB2330_005754 [Saitoella coloradoensis]
MDDLTDEQILALTQDIVDKEGENVPLVGQKKHISALVDEFEGASLIYQLKVEALSQKHSSYRKTRGDGNCFYRAFAMAYFESLLTRPSYNELSRIQSITTSTLDPAGFEPIAYEDFADVTYEILETLPHAVEEDLERRMATPEESNAVVVHFRFLASAFMKLHPEDYEAFLEEPLQTFCEKYVEAVGREADHIMIAALVRVLGVGVDVVYLDQGEGLEPFVHEFRPAGNDSAGVVVRLLYRPGHYDILYTE